jgi:hypothetical protein
MRSRGSIGSSSAGVGRSDQLGTNEVGQEFRAILGKRHDVDSHLHRPLQEMFQSELSSP